MADNKGDPRDAEIIPPSTGFDVSPSQNMPKPSTGMVTVFDTYVTAQNIQIPRSHSRVMMRIKEMALVGGDRFFYRWDAKNRDGTKAPIIGLTIKGANALSVLYGNCSIEARARESDTHIYVAARFVDLETGYQLTREFRQRKSQSLGGKMDRDRQEDIVFQIGQSKAIRNVIVNALDVYAAEMLEWSQKGLVARIEKNRPGAEQAVNDLAQEFGISEKRLELYVGRARKDWTTHHLATVFSALKTVEEGMETADNVFAEGAIPDVKSDDQMEGSKPAAQQQQAGDAPKAEAPKSNRKPAAKPAADAKKAEPPKEEAKPEKSESKAPQVEDDDLASMAGFGSGDGDAGMG